ncbi:Uma2 family endonuclease [Longimicrobium sp.]|jgi:Uma2 family endonuclease|uniref:Uma2 family endonuclease n=1 Tax=Longimicrobium sp. TaxID=2029185 RepID=UPI002F92D8B2
MQALSSDVRVTIDEYLDGIELAEEFREYVDERVRIVPPTTLEHALLVSSIGTVLDRAARRQGCRILRRGMLIGAAGDVFSPDVMAYGGKAQLAHHGDTDLLLNPVLLVEIVSPESWGYERGRKWQGYRSIASLQEYLLVAEDAPRVERFTRHGEHFWLYGETTGLDGEIQLESLNVTLKLADIYDGVLSADSGREE